MANVETPMVAKVHFDDLANQFRLHITFQLQTPLGTHREHFNITLADLAEVVAAITEYWTAGALAGGGSMPAYAGNLHQAGLDLAAKYPAS